MNRWGRRALGWPWLAALVFVFACAGGGDDETADGTPPADDDADDDTGGTPDDDTEAPPPWLEFDPARPGPFPVGNITREFRDHSRWDIASRGERRLLVEIWYPALPTGDEVPPQTIADFLNGWDEFVIGILSYLVAPEDQDNFQRIVASKRGIAPDRSGAPYPVVFFSHGNGGIRFQNWTMAEYLASHGFVVVAPDHTGNAVFVTFSDRVVVMNPLLMPISFSDRWKDISFLLDEMERLTEGDPEGWLTGLVDPTRAGVAGHSFGAATVGEVLRQDPRFAAGLLIAGPAMPWQSPDYHAAVFHMYNDEDHTMEDTKFLMDWSYDAAPPPKFRIDCRDAGHYTFTDACLLIPSLMGEGDGCGMGERLDGGEPFEFIDYALAQAILDSYITAFMGAYLNGFVTHRQYLWTNHFPEDIRYQYTLP